MDSLDQHVTPRDEPEAVSLPRMQDPTVDHILKLANYLNALSERYAQHCEELLEGPAPDEDPDMPPALDRFLADLGPLAQEAALLPEEHERWCLQHMHPGFAIAQTYSSLISEFGTEERITAEIQRILNAEHNPQDALLSFAITMIPAAGLGAALTRSMLEDPNSAVNETLAACNPPCPTRGWYLQFLEEAGACFSNIAKMHSALDGRLDGALSAARPLADGIAGDFVLSLCEALNVATSFAATPLYSGGADASVNYVWPHYIRPSDCSTDDLKKLILPLTTDQMRNALPYLFSDQGLEQHEIVIPTLVSIHDVMGYVQHLSGLAGTLAKAFASQGEADALNSNKIWLAEKVSVFFRRRPDQRGQPRVSIAGKNKFFSDLNLRIDLDWRNGVSFDYGNVSFETGLRYAQDRLRAHAKEPPYHKQVTKSGKLVKRSSVFHAGLRKDASDEEFSSGERFSILTLLLASSGHQVGSRETVMIGHHNYGHMPQQLQDKDFSAVVDALQIALLSKGGTKR